MNRTRLSRLAGIKGKQERISVPLYAVMMALVLSTAGLFVIAGCQRSPSAAPPPVVISAAGFVGNSACITCHAAECQAMAGSRHALTLREAKRESLAETAPPLGAVPLAGYALTEQQGRLVITRQYPKAQSQPLDYVLGSGKTGMTYIAVQGNDRVLEAHMSYFPQKGLWEITPGQEKPQEGDTVFGRIHDVTDSRRCLSCHTTALAPTTISPQPAFYGVGCETCHGPGKAHIEAIQAGHLSDIHMSRLGTLKSTELNDLCGKCHRTLQQIDVETVEANQTHRFQPYGLTRSRCRQADNGPLSCLLCHNPHKDVDTNSGNYNRICLTCHTKTAHSETSAPKMRQASVCPVNASDRCVDCHMRPKNAFPTSSFPGTMVDHLISIPIRK